MIRSVAQCLSSATDPRPLSKCWYMMARGFGSATNACRAGDFAGGPIRAPQRLRLWPHINYMSCSRAVIPRARKAPQTGAQSLREIKKHTHQFVLRSARSPATLPTMQTASIRYRGRVVTDEDVAFI